MAEKLLRAEVRPNGVLWKNALAAYEKMCERRDWVRERVLHMVLQERVVNVEHTVIDLFLLGELPDDDATACERYLAVFQVQGDLDNPATVTLNS